MLTPELLCRPGTEPCKPTYGRDQVLITGLTEQARAEVPPHCGTCRGAAALRHVPASPERRRGRQVRGNRLDRFT